MNQPTLLKLPSCRKLWRSLLYFIAPLIWPVAVQAQFDGGVHDDYNGTAIGLAAANLSPIDTRDFTSIVDFSGTPSAITICPAGNSAEITGSRKIQNIVRLVLNEETSKYLSENFVTSLPIKIEYGHDATSLNIYHQTLTVSYNKEAGSKYNPKNYFSFQGAEYVKVSLEGTFSPTVAGGVNMSDILYIENEMRVTRFYNLQAGVTPVDFSFETPATTPIDHLTVSWSWPYDAGNNGTQLEWTWLDDDMQDNYLFDGDIDLDLLFRDNATRIDLPYNTYGYNIPLFYDGPGKLYYRIRPVNFLPGGGRADGDWTVPGTTGGSTVGIFEFDGHNNDLNWQAKSSFAEEGKMKTVLEYFDGSLRSRQTVTKENVHNTTITAETFYDYQGRPAIQILPAPSMNNVIAYTKNLNLFNTADLNQNPASIFDLQPIAGGGGPAPSTIPGMQTVSGASGYYSWGSESAPDPNTPDAEGFPYTTTRYTPDGTGRIMAQSGVGPAFQMGSGRETRFYYGSPSQEELDALFGTDVGNKSHYFKNMVKDANGQMSISYVDMHGRTIATALAGDAPKITFPGEEEQRDQLIPLPHNDQTQYSNQQDGQMLTRSLLDPGSNIEKGNAVESVTSLLVPAGGEYTFNYTLTPESLEAENCTGDPICYECQYDLEISITDESGDIPPTIFSFNNLSVDKDVDDICSTSNEFVAADENSSGFVENAFSKTVHLDPGSYSVRKTLRISEASLQKYKELFLQQGKGICQTEDDVIESVYNELLTTSNCNNPSETPICERCLTQLGNFPTYRNNYLVSIGLDPGIEATARIEGEINRAFTDELNKCNGLCGTANNSSTLLRARRQMMLADMMPWGGQYATSTPPPPLVAGSGTTMFDKYNIFSTNGGDHIEPFRQPVIYDGTDYVNTYYLDNRGNPDDRLPVDHDKVLLETVDKEDFARYFQNSWAEELIVYHPEYERLIYAEQTFGTGPDNAYVWMDKFNAVDNYADALTAGYIFTQVSASNDPFYGIATSSTATMDGFLTGNFDTKGHSMWQMARMQVLCKNIFVDADRIDCYDINNVISGHDPFDGVTDPDERDQIWRIFRNLYAASRNKLLNDYIADAKPLADGEALINQGYKLWFVTDAQTAQQVGFGDNFSDAATETPPTVAGAGTTPDDAEQYLAGQCDSYINYWKNKLLQCPELQNRSEKETILNEIITGMLAVCKKGTDEANPFGSSTINPANSDGVSPETFEDVIFSVFAAHTITTPDSYYCNPYVIDYPKPYGQGPNYTQEQTQLVGQCACDNFSAMQTAANTAGYNSADFDSFNEWLETKHLDQLTEVMFNALKDCNSYHHLVCGPSIISKTVSCNDPNPCTSICNNTRTAFSSGPVDSAEWVQLISCFFDSQELISPIPANISPECQANFVAFYNQYYQLTGTDTLDWSTLQTNYTTLFGESLSVCSACTRTQVCEVEPVCNDEFLPFILSSPQPLPNYLKCGGWPANDRCLTCDNLNTLTSTFKDRFNSPYNSAPILNVDDLTPDQIQQNILYANFLNFKTGQQLTWAAYAKARLDLNCSGEGEGITAICPDPNPVTDGAGIVVPEDPCAWMHTLAVSIGQKRYKEMVDNMETAFEASYREKCLSAKNYEQFTVGYANKEYHYTLYYYDAAGGLLMTVPPKGVRPVFTDFADVENARTAGTSLQRDHQLVSAYLYNSLGSPWLQISPDAGVSSFWFDKLGRLVVSQNAQQNLDSKFSYTLYDELGRIIEVGQKPQEEPMTQEISQELLEEGALNNWIVTTGNPREQMTITQYDLPFGYDVLSAPTGMFNEYGFYQHNMRNRVSYTLTKNLETDADPDYYTGTFYTYDVHGNVESLLQRYPGINDMESTDNGVKRIAYDYDLISGKVNMVSYQPDVENMGQGEMEPNDDKFFQRYQYDAENKLISVETSRDKIEWERDAAYSYYKHGPLSRLELGQQRVQGLDYAYTLQGWLKGVNGTSVNGGGLDMGYDGFYFTGAPTAPVARDVFAFTLHYYDLTYSEYPDNNGHGDEIDYKNVAGTSYFSRPYNPAFMPLYNGNIAGMSINIAPLQQTNPESAQAGPLFYNYRYDQLNRLKSMNAFTGLNVESENWEPVQLNDFAETINYDPNGNITHYTRSGNQASSATPDMDNLDYQYPTDNNRLTSVSDDVAESYDNDIENTTNYGYDQIGNLTGETNGSSSTTITWTLYGKIASVTKDGHTISYTYDASGNRITKSDEIKTTIYVRDASGNVMSIYERPTEDAIAQTEIPLYGTSRLGMATKLTVPVSTEYLDAEFGSAQISTFTRAEKLFELTNHLGNVLATVTDRKIQNTEDESAVSYYTADVATLQDYYPFGMLMPGRTLSTNLYRYGFNGKENDNDVKGEGNQQDYGMRIYDPRLARFLSVDPLTFQFPELTPYQFASNRPIDGIDLDGLEYSPPMMKDKEGNWVPDGKAAIDNHEAIGKVILEKHAQGMRNVNIAEQARQQAISQGRKDGDGITWSTKAFLYIAPWWNSLAPLSDANDAAVLMSGKNLDNQDATIGDYTAAGVGIFIPFISGSAIKKVFKGFSTSTKGYKYGEEIFKTAKDFEKALSKGGSFEDKKAMIQSVLRNVAENNKWKKSGEVSKKTGHEFYDLGNNTLGSIDELHGHFEIFNRDGKTLKHEGSINIDGVKTKDRNSTYDIKL